jgi:hypothetical protein
MAAHSTGVMKHCLFCATDPMRSDVLRKHCERKHPSGVDVAGKPKSPLGFVWHLIDGHTDRVYATIRGGESKMSVGHCFACHTFIEKDGYKTIDDAVKGHICREVKKRAERAPVAIPKSATSAAAMSGGGSAKMMVAPAKKGMWLTEEKLTEMWAASGGTGVKGQRALPLEHDDDGEINIEDSLDAIVETLVEKQKTENENKRLKAEIVALKAAGVSTTETVPCWDLVIKAAKHRYCPIRHMADALLEKSKALIDEDTAAGEAFLMTVYSAFAETAKRAEQEAKDAAAMDKERAAATGEAARLQQRLADCERYANNRDRDIAALEAKVRELEAKLKKDD